MITLQDYFAGKDNSQECIAQVMDAATELLGRVNDLLWEYQEATDRELRCSPKTLSHISGERHGDGGFRHQNSKTGSALSSHKEGRGVDVYDPGNGIDSYLTDAILEEYGLYREAPASTPGWCHLTTRAPQSGKRTFKP